MTNAIQPAEATGAIETNHRVGVSTVAKYLGAGLLAAFAVRMPAILADIGIDPDEGLSMVIGRTIVQGSLPYVRYFDHRQPLLYGDFAIAQLLFGENPQASRIWATIHVAVAAALVGLIARRLIGRDRAAAAVAIALLPLLSFANGPAAVSELFVWPWTALAVFLALSAGAARGAAGRLGLVAAAGLSLGVASQVKLLALPEGAAVVAAYAIARRSMPRPREWAAVLAILAATVVVPLAAIALVYRALGAWDPFVYSSFTYNRLYSAAARFDVRDFAAYVGRAILMYLPAILLAGIATSARGPARRALWLGAAWAAAAGLASVSTRRFFAHYSLQFLPSLCLLAAAGAAALREWPAPRRRLVVAAAVLAAAPAAVLSARVLTRFRAYPIENAEPRALLARHTRPGGLAFVGNLDPVFYFAAKVDAPTYWLFPYWFGHENWTRTGALDPHAELTRIVDAHPSIVLYTDRLNRGWQQPTIDWFRKLMASRPDYVELKTTDPTLHAFVPATAAAASSRPSLDSTGGRTQD